MLATANQMLHYALKQARLRVHAAALPMSITALEEALSDEMGTLELLKTVADMEPYRFPGFYEEKRDTVKCALHELQDKANGRLTLRPPITSSPSASGAPIPATVAPPEPPEAPTTPETDATPAAETPDATTGEIGRVLAAADEFEVLGVDHRASDEEVEAAYKALRAKLHPDKNGGSQESTDAFTRVLAAYESVPQIRRKPLLDELLRTYRFAHLETWKRSEVHTGALCLGPFTNAKPLQNWANPRAGVSVCLWQAIDEVIEDVQFSQSDDFVGFGRHARGARGSICIDGSRCALHIPLELYTAKRAGTADFIMPNVYLAYSKFISSAASSP